MGERTMWRNTLLNVGLGVAGLVLAALLYAFVTGTLLPRTDAEREANPAGLVGDIIQVEVRNGAGVPELAAQTRTFLVRHNFDVVEVRDHTSFDVAHSFVVDRVGDLEAARKVAAILGIPEQRVRQEIRPDYYLDASVILGRDYASLAPFAGE